MQSLAQSSKKSSDLGKIGVLYNGKYHLLRDNDIIILDEVSRYVLDELFIKVKTTSLS